MNPLPQLSVSQNDRGIHLMENGDSDVISQSKDFVYKIADI